MNLFEALKDIFKKYLIAGLVVLVPLIGTFWILRFIIKAADGFMISLLPAGLNPEAALGMKIPGFGLIATIVLILIVGMLTRLYIGRMMVRFGDRIIARIPLGRGIYHSIKQIVATMFSGERGKFKGVVAVEFPRKGSWAIGFTSGDAPGPVSHISPGDELVNVFVPNTPIPTSGFFIMVPSSEIRPLDMAVDDAFKLIISGGIVDETGLPADGAR
jgi:uncharacterized membrane protein